MKAKTLLGALCMMMLCLGTFTSCSSSDDDGGSGGLTGTYAAPSEYDNYTRQDFRLMIVITKSTFTQYRTCAVQNSTYWGAGTFEVPGSHGWYVEANSARDYSYVTDGSRIVVDNGSIFSIGDGTIVGGGKTYTKIN